MAGPLLIWSVYGIVGPRLYDHSSQVMPYWTALFVALLAPVVALPAAAVACSVRRLPEPHGPA